MLLERVEAEAVTACREFVCLRHRLSFVAPKTLSIPSLGLLRVFRAVDDDHAAPQLLEIIRNLTAFEPRLRDAVDDDTVRAIMGSRLASADTIQLIVASQDRASHSALSGACVAHCSHEDEDDVTRLLVRPLEGGLVLGETAIPATDITKLALANVLWATWPTKRDVLSAYMLSAMDRARSTGPPLFMNSATVRAMHAILREFCPDKLAEAPADGPGKP